MTSRTLLTSLVALALTGPAAVAFAQGAGTNPGGTQQGGGSQGETREDGSQLITGPAKVGYGPLQLILGEGAAAETRYQPDSRQLSVKTLQGEARVVTPAKNLVMVENIGGKTEIKLPNGRLIKVEPGRTEIVGQAMVDDPGQIVIRFAGLGPLALAGDAPVGTATQAVVTVLTGPAPALLGTIVPQIQSNSPRPEGTCLSPLSPNCPP